MAINMIIARLDTIERKISEVSSSETTLPNTDPLLHLLPDRLSTVEQALQKLNAEPLLHLLQDRLSNAEQAIERLIAKVGSIEANLVSHQEQMQKVQSQINTLFAPGEI